MSNGKWSERCLQCNHFLARWKVEFGVNFCSSACLHTYLEDKGQTDLVGDECYDHEGKGQQTSGTGSAEREAPSN